MKQISRQAKNRILLIAITALAICLCCVFAACSKAQAESDPAHRDLQPTRFSAKAVVGSGAGNTQATAENYSRWLSDHYSAQVDTCEMWLADLMDALGVPAADASDSRSVIAAAVGQGLIDNKNAEPYSALTRRYVARTLVKALDYQPQRVDGLADLAADDIDVSTLVYYGYFVPDAADMVYPDASVTDEEYARLLDEVRLYMRLKGKKVLAFGDSIMYGMGNRDHGISDMIAEKYGMADLDYSVSGAVFGVVKDRNHIADQIVTASKLNLEPDVILLNGGTNDMEFGKRGDLTVRYAPRNFDKTTFCGGFEYAVYLLQKYWKDVPVLYIRAHDMDTVDDLVEQDFGETALTIADKWGVTSVDIYNESELCTELTEMREAYTSYRTKLGKKDGIHPTALGYAKFYLPLISQTFSEMMK